MEEYYFHPEVYFFPVFTVIAVATATLIAITLISRYVYERRQAHTETLEVELEKMILGLDASENEKETLEILRKALKKARGPHRRTFINLLKEIDEPKRTQYLDYILSHLGKDSLINQALSARSKWKRIDAIEILGEIENFETLDTLIKCLEDGDEDLVYATVGALTRKKNLKAADAVLKLIGSGRVNDRQLVAMLEDFATPIDERVWPLLENPSARIRFWAALLLGASNNPETVKRLMKLAKDSDADVRSAAVQSLARIGHPDGKEVISAAIQDKKWFVRAQAARAVAALNAKDLFEEVICLLWDKNWWVRQSTKMALLKFCPDIEEDLMQFLLVEDEFARNMVAEVLEMSGAVERHGKELEKNPASTRQRMFFMALAQAGAENSIKDLIEKTTPEARKFLKDILASETTETSSEGEK